MYVDLSRFPDQNKLHTVDFPQLDGGWNINVRGYKLPQNESPDMKNLWWQDGMLRCRDGQSEVPTQTPADEPGLTGKTYAVYDSTFYGYGFAHIGRTVYYFDPTTESVTYHPMLQNVNPTGGSFFRYGDDLFYKNGAWSETINEGADNAQQVTHHGGYYRIRYVPEDKLRFVMSDVSQEAFVPTILLNADPSTGAGDRYQPENRLSRMKKVLYSPVIYDENRDFAGDGKKTEFKRDMMPSPISAAYYVKEVQINEKRVGEDEYEVVDNGSDAAGVKFNKAPDAGAKILIKYQYCDQAYTPPVTSVSRADYLITTTATGDGETDEFSSADLVKQSADYIEPGGLTDEGLQVVKVFLNGTWLAEDAYTIDLWGSEGSPTNPAATKAWNVIRFREIPARGAQIKFYIHVEQRYRTMAAERVIVAGAEYAPDTQHIAPFPSVEGGTEYQLEKGDDGRYPIVAGATYTPALEIEPEVSYDRTTGVMRLSFALPRGTTIQPKPAGKFSTTKDKVFLNPSPAVSDVAFPNAVEITFDAPNPDARDAVMDCCYATTSGGENGLCILLGGCPAQPNAVFWNSNDNLSMNPAYFPLEYYNLVGDTEDAVTGFGRQYNDLIVFKERSLCKMEYSTQTLDGRIAVSFTYKAVNAQIGCDLPQTIQLIENNLVFCNTYAGVHILLSSSAAYENNVERISLKVNGDPERETRGLLYDVRRSDVPVTSFDDDHRYWLLVGDHAYLWDYEISGYKNPSWFYLEGLRGMSYFRDPAHTLYHIGDWGGRLGRLTKFSSSFSDYDQPISKHYEFPIQLLGGISRLKDVTKAVFSFGVDAASDIGLTYLTNLETRADLTGIHVPAPSAGVLPGPHIVIRRPMCRHIRTFSMRLENNTAGQDLAIVSAQLQYTLQDMDR